MAKFIEPLRRVHFAMTGTTSFQTGASAQAALEARIASVGRGSLIVLRAAASPSHICARVGPGNCHGRTGACMGLYRPRSPYNRESAVAWSWLAARHRICPPFGNYLLSAVRLNTTKTVPVDKAPCADFNLNCLTPQPCAPVSTKACSRSGTTCICDAATLGFNAGHAASLGASIWCCRQHATSTRRANIRQNVLGHAASPS